jgi:type I site-specific restriction endonuclease
MLLEGQQDDVMFAEQRFANPDKQPGVMFTNGTGTGKTYTGLGIIKRQVRMGKTAGIVLVPNNQTGSTRAAPTSAW